MTLTRAPYRCQYKEENSLGFVTNGLFVDYDGPYPRYIVAHVWVEEMKSEYDNPSVVVYINVEVWKIMGRYV